MARRKWTRAELEPLPWFDGNQAADWIGVSWPTLREWIVTHQVPRVKFGRLWRIERAVLDDYMRRVAQENVRL